MKIKLMVLSLFTLLFTTFAFSEEYQAVYFVPEKVLIETELYNIEMCPIRIPYQEGWGPKAFKIQIYNKSDKNIDILWDSTFYIINGAAEGVFYTYGDKKEIKNESILPHNKIEKSIAPAYLLRVDFAPIQYFKTGSWQFHTEFPIGKNGISLQLNIDGKKFTERTEMEFILK